MKVNFKIAYLPNVGNLIERKIAFIIFYLMVESVYPSYMLACSWKSGFLGLGYKCFGSAGTPLVCRDDVLEVGLEKVIATRETI